MLVPPTTLSVKTLVRVRFSETDSLGIVWHGNYLKFFEDGREDFAQQHSINFISCYNDNYSMPLIKSEMNYKKSMRYGDVGILETRHIDCDAAKIIFAYTLFDKAEKEIYCTGQTIQVFVNNQGELLLNYPLQFQQWRKKYLGK